MTGRFEEVRRLVLEAAEVPPEERTAWLAQACAGDDALRADVESLLSYRTSDDALLRTAGAVARGLPIDPAEAVMIGSWEVLDVLGESSGGRLYRARRRGPDTSEAAVLVLAAGADTDRVVEAIAAERDALVGLKGIALPIDHGRTDSGDPFFATGFVRGQRIDDYCDQSHLTVRDRVQLAEAVCRAVGRAHGLGVAHGALTTSRVLVTRSGGAATPIVLGYGAPRASSGDGPAVAAADVAALGGFLHELLVGERPTSTGSPPAPSTRVLEMNATSGAQRRRTTPEQWSRELRGDLDRIIGCCLVPDAGAVYPSATELANDLAGTLANPTGRGAGSGRLRRRLRQLGAALRGTRRDR
ncbi:MAG: hypothetical protein DHS20C21_21460 [Gemmatimonadota bacterium]|nr:MAG: hypothetical protein DHS20C21_21460 [Gemmatimonadota bacterium]